MQYAILCYHDEAAVNALTKEQDDALMAELELVRRKLEAKLGPIARLMPTTAATTLRAGAEPLVIDGPFAETKEALLGFYVIECATPRGGDRGGAPADGAAHGGGAHERSGDPPDLGLLSREGRRVSDLAWLDAALTSARPQALGALLRYFRNLDRAEEAFQEACLRALRNWPVNGPPRDPAAWLIFVGRNAALDQVRRQSSEEPLPPEELISDDDDAEAALAERIDSSHYRDDVLRLLFICCHPDLPATQQIALALRIVSGLSVKEIARAFLVGESAMEQRITRAKRRVAEARVPFETPGAVERSERRRRRRRHDLPAVQRGLLGERRRGAYPRAALRGGDPARPAAAAAVPGRARDHGARRAAAPAACPRAGPARCRGLHRAHGGPGPGLCGTRR